MENKLLYRESNQAIFRSNEEIKENIIRASPKNQLNISKSSPYLAENQTGSQFLQNKKSYNELPYGTPKNNEIQDHIHKVKLNIFLKKVIKLNKI